MNNKRTLKFKWVGRNKKFGTIRITMPMSTQDLLYNRFEAFFDVTNRGDSGNCEFLAEIQYTGQNDKNGLEIYEGDIVQRRSEDSEGGYKKGDIMYAGSVVWSNVVSAFVIRKGFDFQMFATYDHEIIGSIYENLEKTNEKND